MTTKANEFKIMLDKGFNPAAFVLIKEGNKSETVGGRVVQACHTAYIDGYVTANGELSRFVTHLWRTDKKAAATVYRALKPFCALQDASYTAMCKRLNDKATWDEKEDTDND